jgi:WD40 repeat protein
LPDGRIVSGSFDKILRIWDATTLECMSTFKGHTASITALAILPDGRIVSGSFDKTLRIWDATTLQCIAILAGHTASVTALAILPDGRIVSGSGDSTLHIWDATTLQCIAILAGHTASVTALAILPDGRIVSGSFDKILRIWDTSIKNPNHLNLLLLDKLQPQLSVRDNLLELNFDVANNLHAMHTEERQAAINAYRTVIQLCFGLMPSAESNPLYLTYHCQDAAQALSLKQFLQQCWKTRQYRRQQILPTIANDRPTLLPELPVHPTFELRPLAVTELLRMLPQLETNSAICTLNLAGIPLGKEGLSCLLQLIRTNKTLTFINLNCTGLTDSEVKQILNALKINHTLMRLNLKDNAISDGLLKQFEAHFTHKNISRLNEVEIPLAELDMSTKQSLGQGAYGEVYRIQWNNLPVAVKELRPTTSETMQKQFKREALMLASFKHPYIVQLHGVNFSDKMRIIMEYVSGGSLQSLLDKQTQPFAITQQCRYALDIAYGLAFIHDSQILHLDLKPDNILVCADGRLKITDFGTSLLHEQVNQTVANQRGTRSYMAPEVWEAVDKSGYTFKADIFSYGVLLWEISSCKRAYANYYNEEGKLNEILVYKHVVQQEKRPEPNKPSKTTEGIATLISRCWAQRREERPDADEIIICLEKEYKSCSA